MDKQLFAELMADAPKFNQDIVQGLATKEMDHIEEYVDRRIFRVAAAEFPPSLEYLYGERCSPEEEDAEILRRQISQKKATFETAPSDMYMMKYHFTFEGKPLQPLYLMLPYVRQGGMIKIRGSLFHVIPVVADRSISVGTDSIFLPVSRASMNFSRMSYNIRVNGRREPQYLVHAKLHNKPDKAGGRGRSILNNLKTTLPHYLFAQYGLAQAFEKYCGATIFVGYSDTINTTNYPPKDWVICSSYYETTRDEPVGQYGSQVRIAIRKQISESGKSYLNTGLSRATVTMVTGFFYLADHFPDRVIPEYVDDRNLWIVLLGQLLFGANLNLGMVTEGVLAHLNSLDKALDPESRDNLIREGIPCENLYDVLANLSDTFSERVTGAVKTVPSMYGKRLTILRYVLRDLSRSVNKFMFQITKDTNNRRRPLNAQDILNQMRRYIKWDLLYKISGSNHGEVVSVSCPGDNMLFKLTAQTVLQTESSGPRSRTGTARGRGGVDASKFLDVSIATHGSYSTMSKSEPSGRNKLNPYGTIDAEGMLYMDTALADMLDVVQEMIQH